MNISPTENKVAVIVIIASFYFKVGGLRSVRLCFIRVACSECFWLRSMRVSFDRSVVYTTHQITVAFIVIRTIKNMLHIRNIVALIVIISCSSQESVQHLVQNHYQYYFHIYTYMDQLTGFRTPQQCFWLRSMRLCFWST